MAAYLKLIFCFVFAADSAILRAQSLQFENLPIELKPRQQLNTSPFKRVTVLDKRFDTSKMGYVFVGQRYRNLLLKPSVPAGLENYFNNCFEKNTAGDRTLLIVLRTLWLHDMKSGEKNKEDFNDEQKNISECIIKADIYSFKDKYYQALIRIDTIFESTQPSREIAADFLSAALDYTISRVFSMDVEQMLTRKSKISENNLINYYNDRLNHSRIINNSLQRGIFLTFKDFLNNQPATHKFHLEQDRESDYLYLEENGEEKLFTDFWGFSDGQNLYIRLGNSFFKLIRDNNTYSLWGCRQAIHTTPTRNKNRVVRYLAFGSLANLRTARLGNIIRPMQIDMETGIAY